ncbi:DUF998 domain-containing protein [Streptacidiphilus sp. MAP12-20]|uniref:DUF998 domain-containing protein n=1 Tax=Streptacidiphilus sp. MAP12-20 TaxID=3156299 RepID=UPI0035178BDE
MRRVPWWAVVSSGAAPVVLIGGWVVGAALQAPGYDPVTDTISELAGSGAAFPWLMGGAIGVLGVCHMVTALGLRVAGLAGRVALAAGGAASILVACSPVPPSGGSMRHSTGVVLGYSFLAVWPTLAAYRRRDLSAWGLRPVLSVTVTALFLLGALWFLEELWGHGAAGLVERLLTTGQAVWPLVVVGSCVGLGSKWLGWGRQGSRWRGSRWRGPRWLAAARVVHAEPAAVRDAWGRGRVQAGGMSANTLVTVHAVVPGTRPFRRVEIQGYDAGPAFRPEDVLRLCRDRGFHDVNLDDPAVVTWLGGDAKTWA